MLVRAKKKRLTEGFTPIQMCGLFTLCIFSHNRFVSILAIIPAGCVLYNKFSQLSRQQLVSEKLMYLLQYTSGVAKDTIKCCLYKDPCLEYQTTRKLLEWFGHPFRIDDIRIPRRPWDERLHSMIARLKRGTFQQKHKQTLVSRG